MIQFMPINTQDQRDYQMSNSISTGANYVYLFIHVQSVQNSLVKILAHNSLCEQRHNILYFYRFFSNYIYYINRQDHSHNNRF